MIADTRSDFEGNWTVAISSGIYLKEGMKSWKSRFLTICQTN